jgi:hypothetical protein
MFFIQIVPGSGNHPQTEKSTLLSPVRPTVTSTPSASRTSPCNRAPSVPGPLEEMAPEDETTRCHGTGGVAPGVTNLSAKPQPFQQEQ